MKFLFFLTLVAASFASAQIPMQMPQQGTSRASMSGPEASRGLRISLIKPFFESESKNTQSFGTEKTTETNRETLDNTNGVGLAYAFLPVQRLGLITQASYFKIEGEKGAEDLELLRAEGNLAYAFSGTFYLKGGVNIGKLTHEKYKNVESHLGGQVGLGMQFTQHFGAELNYGVMRFTQSIQIDDLSAKSEIAIQGMELGLTGTF